MGEEAGTGVADKVDLEETDGVVGTDGVDLGFDAVAFGVADLGGFVGIGAEDDVKLGNRVKKGTVAGGGNGASADGRAGGGGGRA